MGKQQVLTLDKEFEIPVYSPVCLLCAHLDHEAFVRGARRCRAFADIPLPIWRGEHSHRGPYPGDKGVRFKPIRS